MPRRTPRLRSLAALAVLVAVTVGIPVLLIAIAGWPLPRQLPDWNGIRTALQQGDIPAEVVINTLAVVVWIAWAQLVWALGWELAVNLPRTQNGEPAKAAPLVPAALGSGVGRLVAVLFAVGLTVATTPTPSPRPTGRCRPQRSSSSRPPAAAAPSAAPTQPPAATSACWQVTEHDNLWDIAERVARRRRPSHRDPRAQPRRALGTRPARRPTAAPPRRRRRPRRPPDPTARCARTVDAGAPAAVTRLPGRSRHHDRSRRHPVGPLRSAPARRQRRACRPGGNRSPTSTRSSPPTPTPSRTPTSSTPASSSASPPSAHHPRLRRRHPPSRRPPPRRTRRTRRGGASTADGAATAGSSDRAARPSPSRR